jgi:hypothetical protein
MHTTTIIRAELGGNTCTAMGITATGCAPIPAMCRALLAAGIDPSWPLPLVRQSPPMDAVAWLAKLRRRQRQRRLHHQKCAAAARERKRLRKQRGLL